MPFDWPGCYATEKYMTQGSLRRVTQTFCRVLMSGLGGMLFTLMAQAASVPDARLVYTQHSPDWLRAIGQLQVPGNRVLNGRRAHHREDCSATLVARSGSTRADTIITAWHCLEFYNDLSKPITFTLLPGSGAKITREAYPLADGGGMHADWAILRLYQAVPTRQVAAMRIHPERADPSRPVTMAGYSRDIGRGNKGEHLTFDPACAIIHQARDITDSNCTAHKGASGGAVIQLSPRGEPRVCGIISQGDGVGRSTFVPVNGFRNAINLHLK